MSRAKPPPRKTILRALMFALTTLYALEVFTGWLHSPTTDNRLLLYGALLLIVQIMPAD